MNEHEDPFKIKIEHPQLYGKLFDPKKGKLLLVIFQEDDNSEYPKIIKAYQCKASQGIDYILEQQHKDCTNYCVYTIHLIRGDVIDF